MAVGKRNEPRAAGKATNSDETEAGLRADAAGRIGGKIVVLEDRDGRAVAVERDLTDGDASATTIRDGRPVAVTSDGRKHDLGPAR